MDNRQLKDIIEEIIRKEDTDLKAIAGKVRRDRSYISALINSTEKKDITDKLYNVFKAQFPGYFEIPPQTNKNNTSQALQDAPRQANAHSGDMTMQALVNMTESNRMLAEAQRITAETLRLREENSGIIARAHEELVQMTKVARGISTVYGDPQTLADTIGTVKGMRALLVDVVAHVTGKSATQVSRDLNIKVKAEIDQALHRDIVHQAADGR